MTIVPEGKHCYCGKRGCLDAYCSARCLSDMTDGKLEKFFGRLEAGEEEIVSAWDKYTSYLAIAVNNIHMILDCDIILGGYAGSYMENHIQAIQDKVVRRNTFTEENTFVRACSYKFEAAAMGASLKVIETFIEQV